MANTKRVDTYQGLPLDVITSLPADYLSKHVVNQYFKEKAQDNDADYDPTTVSSEVYIKTIQMYNKRNTLALDEYHQNIETARKAAKNAGKSKSAIEATAKAVPRPNLWIAPSTLPPSQIALILNHQYHIVLLNLTNSESDSDLDQLAVYQTQGINKGIYTGDDDDLARLARQYNFNISTRDIKEIMAILRTIVPHVSRNLNQDLIPVNNGIFNYKTKKLLPFSHEYVFISKSHIDYHDSPINPVLTNQDGTKWDVVSWMNDLSDDPEIVNVLWQMLGAIIRPNVSWDKSAWLYSTRGNNGKGTLCELMRNLCGPGSYAKVSLRDFSQDFLLEPLTHASAIITDENDVGTFIDKAANLKAVETGDVITINRKYKPAIAYQFKGFMVQCLNEFPKVKDRTNSFYRRQLFIPMTKNFQGHENKDIKQKYLQNKKVLEYVLYYVLNKVSNGDYYKLDTPDACKITMEEYKDTNDPIRQFLSEMLPQTVWDMLPFNFLYDLYRAWFTHNIPNGKAVSSRAFNDELKDIFTGQTVDDFTFNPGQTATGHKMDKPEPLILTYNLRNWFNQSYTGSDRMRKCTIVPKRRYTALVRV